MTGTHNGRVLKLKAGDLVQVRDKQEILATLDETGKLDGLPFMPEMLPFCGKPFRVFKRADKTCDPAPGEKWCMRQMKDVVHLEGLRCDGGGHGGCQAGCLLFWKESWLRKLDSEEEVAPANVLIQLSGAARPSVSSPICTDDALIKATRYADDATGEPRFSCQATEVRRISPVLEWWKPGQYVRDICSGNTTLRTMVRAAIIALFNKLQRLRNGSPYPFIEGKLKQSPVEVLNLQPGELVEVKSKAEILATLHLSEKNRGLSFDSEMVRHCGRQFRVLRRVERIIDEKTGTLTHMKGDCIVLDGAVCAADYHRFCPRSIYPYWREIWLRRAGDARRGPELPLPRIDRLLDRWLPLQGCSKTTAAACETIPVHPLPR